MKGVFVFGPIVVLIVCTLLIQGLSGRPRLRHSHRKLRCSKCPPGWGVTRACTSIEDTLCARCGQGQYSPHHSYHNPCWLCSRCGTGLYEAHGCSASADTVCDTCTRATSRGGATNDDFYDKCVDDDDNNNVTDTLTYSAKIKR